MNEIIERKNIDREEGYDRILKINVNQGGGNT